MSRVVDSLRSVISLRPEVLALVVLACKAAAMIEISVS